MNSHAAGGGPVAPHDEIAISVDNLTVTRGKRRVLDDFSCQIPRGRVTGLLGPSGSGKTTLMRAIVGVQRTVSGSVTVFGKPAGSADIRAVTGYVTQSPSVYADMTVTENVRYFARIVGADRGDATRAIGEVGLTDAAHQLTRDLSGGQLSRASLACALVGEPQLLVLDEPTVGQDPVLREDLWAVFHRYAQRGAAVLVSSHVMDEAKRCDALMLLRDGALLADNTPQGILRAADTDDMDTAFLTLIRRIGTEVTA
jgi:ABC-2 type transport system ATP-binding protein